ncbi:hypothetical protein [Pseudomonas oligotrophica]|nr:hypothetical protein [Pseudomonas oligotrophica]MCF7203796.1 hypothetical protein [Pseudomonas oligotrophica]
MNDPEQPAPAPERKEPGQPIPVDEPETGEEPEQKVGKTFRRPSDHN